MTILALLQAAVPIVAFLLMVAVGLDVTQDDLRRLAGRRRFVLLATAAQTVVLPAAALVLIRALPADSRVSDYLLLIAACPGGGMSNVYVYLARANTALSVTLTALSCVGAVVTMPLVTLAYAFVISRPVGFELPFTTLLTQLLFMAVIPVCAGAWIRYRWPGFEKRHGGTLRAVSAAGVVVIVSLGVVQTAGTLDAVLVAAGFVAAGLVAAGMAAGWIVASLAHASLPDRFTLLVEFAVRNLAIAMVIEVTLLGNADFVAFGALALLAQAMFLMAAARIYTRRV